MSRYSQGEVEMKITDNQILEYLWDEMLNTVAANTFIYYMGNKLGTYDIEELTDDDFRRFALLYRTQLYAGTTLSKCQFRVRLNKLVTQGVLLPELGKDSQYFTINADVKPIAINAIEFWQSAGLPFGYTDHTKTCRKTIPAGNINLFQLSKTCYQILRYKYPTYQIRGK